jgi:hypothetical protein
MSNKRCTTRASLGRVFSTYENVSGWGAWTPQAQIAYGIDPSTSFEEANTDSESNTLATPTQSRIRSLE